MNAAFETFTSAKNDKTAIVYTLADQAYNRVLKLYSDKDALFVNQDLPFKVYNTYVTNYTFHGPSVQEVAALPFPASNKAFFNISKATKGQYVQLHYSAYPTDLIIESLTDTIYDGSLTNNPDVEIFTDGTSVLTLKFDKLKAGDYKVSSSYIDSIDLLTMPLLPSIVVENVSVSGKTLSLDYFADLPSSKATISLFLNPKEDGVFGVALDTILDAQSAATNVSLDLSTVVSGTYFLTAMLRDSSGYERYDKWPQAIHITNNPTYSSIPTLSGVANDSTAVLSWDSIGDNHYYFIHYTDDGSAVDYSSPSFGVYDYTYTTLGWLTAGRDYKFRVCAADTAFREGPLSNELSINFISNSKNNEPEITNKHEAVKSAFRGSAYSFQVAANDEDNDALSYQVISDNTTGISISSSGLISWSPSVSDSVIHQINVTVTDGKGGIDSLKYELHVQDAETKCGFIGLSRVVFEDIEQKAIIRTRDYDRAGQNYETYDTFQLKVWSDSDPNGILLNVRETEKRDRSNWAQGYFGFTKAASNGNLLKVVSGDKVYAYYNDATCPDSVKTFAYYQESESLFKILNDSACSGEEVLLGNYSEGELLRYNWDFGDGTIVEQGDRHMAHTYYVEDGMGYDSFAVKLTIVDYLNNIDSLTKWVHIKRKPKILFTNDTNLCLRDTLTLSAAIVSDNSVSYQWLGPDLITGYVDSVAYANPSVDSSFILKVSEDWGCDNEDTTHVDLRALPTASFTTDTTEYCLRGNLVEFVSTSTSTDGLLDSLVWSFDNDSIRQGIAYASTQYAYDTARRYAPSLRVYSEYGCGDTATSIIDMHPMPVSQFAADTVAKCFNSQPFVLTQSSSIASGSLTSEWIFGDGQAATTANYAKNYTTHGDYTIQLITRSNFDCWDTLATSVSVYPEPKAALTINDTTQCQQGHEIVATDNSLISGSTMLGNRWTTDQTVAANEGIFSHIYDTTGTFSLTLYAQTVDGCIDSTTKSVIIHPDPVSAFSFENACLNYNNIPFGNNSSITDGTLTYAWQLGDGSTSTLQSPSHSYAAFGTFDVRLIAASNFDCYDTLTKQLIIHPNPKTSIAMSDTSQCVNDQDFWTNSSATIDQGAIAQYRWYWGDGDSTVSQNASHSYGLDNNFTIMHVVLSDSNCTDTATQNIYVRPKPNSAFSIANDKQCETGNDFVLTRNSTLKYGVISSEYNLGDGQEIAAPNTSHRYATFGTYTIKLVDTSDFGCLDSVSQEAEVYPMPQPAFALVDSAQCENTNKIEYRNSSTIPQGSLTYSWFFGDGNTSRFTEPNHTFSSHSSYVSKLLATSDKGCKDSTTRTVIIHEVPVPRFSISQDEQCEIVNDYSFINGSTLSSGSMSYKWDYDDGNLTTNIDGENTFSTYGEYNVKLVAISENLCKDSISQKATVHPKPRSAFDLASDSNQCENDNYYRFANTSVIPYGNIEYNWNFDNGNASTESNPSQVYSADGDYIVQLASTSDKGCRDTVYRMITIDPISEVVIAVDSVCLNEASEFTEIGILPKGTKVEWLWTFGDGNTSKEQNPQHVYEIPNTYNVSLQITTDKECVSDSIFRDIAHVEGLPTADFTSLRIQSGDINTFMQFTELATDDEAWDWNFDNGEYGSKPIENVEFQDTGVYCISLTVSDWFGCKDEDVKCMTIYPEHQFFDVNGFSPNGDGLNDEFTFAGSKYFKEYNLQVFNKWGALLFESTDVEDKWDGMYNGVPVQPGSYIYTFTVRDLEDKSHTYKGVINVVK